MQIPLDKPVSPPAKNEESDKDEAPSGFGTVRGRDVYEAVSPAEMPESNRFRSGSPTSERRFESVSSIESEYSSGDADSNDDLTEVQKTFCERLSDEDKVVFQECCSSERDIILSFDQDEQDDYFELEPQEQSPYLTLSAEQRVAFMAFDIEERERVLASDSIEREILFKLPSGSHELFVSQSSGGE